MKKSKAHDRQIKPKAKAEKRSEPLQESSWSFFSFVYKVIVPVCVTALAFYIAYQGFQETRINTPFSSDKLVELSLLDKHDYYWGTYRPGVYFGTKTRVPYSLVTGMMWYFPDLRPFKLRHWCSQDDRLQRYGWTKHDGKNFGIQEIVDNGVLIKTTFVKNIRGKNGGDWTANINITQIHPNSMKKISLLYYTAIENKTNGYINTIMDRLNIDKVNKNILLGVQGQTDDLGYFNINFLNVRGKKVHHSYLAAEAPNLGVLTELLLYSLQVVDNKIVLPGEMLRHSSGQTLAPNFIVKQVTAELPLELEIRFERNSKKNENEKLTGENFKRALKNHEKNFDDKFENIFKLKEKGFKEEEINFAKLAFSNMIGSIGYFYGSAQVQSIYNQKPVPYWKASLFTAVPSRSFFPRGFLWDEGFHGLLLLQWNLDLEMDIISHWFDLMNVEGWIPREMILGEEALAKVPEEFVVQQNTNANPPTFLLTLNYILENKKNEISEKHFNLLEKLYPRLQVWYNWYNTTQKGEFPSTYRWRGRNSQTNRELNPKTLTSGFDDYPRSSHPTDSERHIDLRCWMAIASKVMANIADILQRPSQKYKDTYDYLSDNELLNKLHWSSKTNRYADYGLHTDKVKLQKPNQASRHNQGSEEMIRIVMEKPKYQLVDSTFGYVSLFPFLLRLIDPNSYQLQKILEDLQKPDLLWTKMGLRSLSNTSPLYMKYNTEHDGPYWRGPIWINVNYLTVAALHHYSKVDGPHREKAKEIYIDLRKNLINNIFRQYNKTGYLWENYGDETGEGKGSHPFTGWTSLVVLLMAELY